MAGCRTRRDRAAFGATHVIASATVVSRPRRRLRQILSGGDCSPAAPVFDPLSSRIAEVVGFDVCKLSGSVAKAANLGLPDDVALADLSDLVGICERITRVTGIALMIDADDGGANVLTVRRAVQELEAAGAAAIEIEDNAVPPGFRGGLKRHALMIDKAEQVAKLRSAVAARRDPDTVIVARTSALGELPLDDALDRIHAYGLTGVDAVMLPGYPPRGRADIVAAARATDLPLCVLGLPRDVVADAGFLRANRIRVRYLGQPPYRMAVRAIFDSLMHLKEGRDPAELRDREATPDMLRAVTKVADLEEWERSFEG